MDFGKYGAKRFLKGCRSVYCAGVHTNVLIGSSVQYERGLGSVFLPTMHLPVPEICIQHLKNLHGTGRTYRFVHAKNWVAVLQQRLVYFTIVGVEEQMAVLFKSQKTSRAHCYVAGSMTPA